MPFSVSAAEPSLLSRREWVYIPGFFFGLGGSFMTAWKLFRSIMKREEEEKKKRETAAFNQHRG